MSIRVEFIGVCTHLMRDPEKGTGALSVPHRVVLVNARRDVDFKGKGIVPAHEASLRIRGLRGERKILGLDEPATTWRINGAMLTITPVPADAEVRYTRNWNVPRIEELPPGKLIESTLGPLGDPEVMVACFDVTNGLFEPTCHHKAHGAILTIDDAGPNPQLVISGLGTPGPGTVLELTENAEIQVQHIATRHSHADANHFLLHYLIGGKQLPPGAKEFKEPCGGEPAISGPISLGPDCSNSSYP